MAEKLPPSILHSAVKPETAGTVGNVKADEQVFAGAVIAGAAGKTTAVIVLS